jgi:hypothetical protein
MRIAIICLAVFLVTSCSESEKKHNLEFNLSLLEGRWEMVNGNERTIEEWKINDVGAEGIGVVLVNERDTVFIEYMRLEPVDTTWQFVVRNKPEVDSPSVSFRMTECTTSEMVFENPEHDHPNIICYRLLPNNRLHAYIEGTVDGQKSRTDFEYVRK